MPFAPSGAALLYMPAFFVPRCQRQRGPFTARDKEAFQTEKCPTPKGVVCAVVGFGPSPLGTERKQRVCPLGTRRIVGFGPSPKGTERKRSGSPKGKRDEYNVPKGLRSPLGTERNTSLSAFAPTGGQRCALWARGGIYCASFSLPLWGKRNRLRRLQLV